MEFAPAPEKILEESQMYLEIWLMISIWIFL